MVKKRSRSWWWWWWWWNRRLLLRKQRKILEGLSLKNGQQVLEKLITSFNGQTLPLRVYSLKELTDATNGFDESRLMERETGRVLTDIGALLNPKDRWWDLFRGFHDGRTFSVKKFYTWAPHEEYRQGMVINEIAVASQMGKHSNFFRLLGYCTESELPMLVYEDVTGGPLSRYIFSALRFDTRLKIANEIASAVSFLHYGTSRTVIHANISTCSVFLDESFSPKFGDFMFSLLIPLGEDHVINTPRGALGYLAPEVSRNRCRYTEKTDVYAFGVTVFEILSGKRIAQIEGYEQWLEEPEPGFDFFARIMEIFEGDDIPGGAEGQQLEECAKLIAKCLRISPDERPTMIEVAQAIRTIRRHPARNSVTCKTGLG